MIKVSKIIKKIRRIKTDMGALMKIPMTMVIVQLEKTPTNKKLYQVRIIGCCRTEVEYLSRYRYQQIGYNHRPRGVKCNQNTESRGGRPKNKQKDALTVKERTQQTTGSKKSSNREGNCTCREKRGSTSFNNKGRQLGQARM